MGAEGVPRERPAAQLITIGELEDRAGVSAATLRAWEQRHGFPRPVRTTGGQRRYQAADVDLVLRVLDERRRGLTLSAAVRAATREDHVGAESLFATLRRAHPHLDPIRASMHVMKALTWSIEDECLAHASRPLVFGCFQTEETFRIAGRRWRELARSASTAVALSDFERTDAAARPARVALPADSPLLNEWALVCVDPGLHVVLAAWEPPRTGQARGPRRFESLLSLEPDVVRDAAALCAQVAAENGLPDLPALTSADTDGLAEDPRRSASLLRRFAAYADA